MGRHPGAPEIPPESTRVEVLLAAERVGARLTLRHTGLPADLGEETRSGWIDYLERLRTACAR